ncbi:MAG: DUF533 domain-containing protein [Pirellulaceae bacterium]
MDAVKVLGAMLSQRAARNGGRGAVLGQVLNGIANAHEQHQHVDPRFDPRHHAPLEHIVREGVTRYQHGGGQLYPPGSQWVNQHRPHQPPTVRSVPRPRHDDHDDHRHGSGLGYNQRAELLTLAMIMAAQADGKLDQAEQDNIIAQLQPLDQNESDFLRREFRRRHDVHDFVHKVPAGMEYEVYQVSLMGMHLDTQAEANYLRALAECLRIQPQVCNQMHQRVGAPLLY